MKIQALGVLALCAIALAVEARAEEKVNQCVACHGSRPDVIALGHTFGAWKESEHASRGVTCEQCHGGDPTATDFDAAHKGALPAAQPDSWVSKTRQAATCGTCHEAQYAAYQKTVHSKKLDALGKGATCITCHDAVGNSLPSPAELSSRCAACHAKPMQAHIALSVLATTKHRLHSTRLDVDALRVTEPEFHQNATERLDELDQRYHAIQLEWHTFATEALIRDSRDLLALAKLVDDEAKKHREMEKRGN